MSACELIVFEAETVVASVSEEGAQAGSSPALSCNPGSQDTGGVFHVCACHLRASVLAAVTARGRGKPEFSLT